MVSLLLLVTNKHFWTTKNFAQILTRCHLYVLNRNGFTGEEQAGIQPSLALLSWPDALIYGLHLTDLLTENKSTYMHSSFWH